MGRMCGVLEKEVSPDQSNRSWRCCGACARVGSGFGGFVNGRHEKMIVYRVYRVYRVCKCVWLCAKIVSVDPTLPFEHF